MSNKAKRHGKYKKHMYKPVHKSNWQKFKEYMLKESGSGMKAQPNWLSWLFIVGILVVIIIELV